MTTPTTIKDINVHMYTVDRWMVTRDNLAWAIKQIFMVSVWLLLRIALFADIPTYNLLLANNNLRGSNVLK